MPNDNHHSYYYTNTTELGNSHSIELSRINLFKLTHGNEHTSTTEMISLGPRTLGSNSTSALLVAKATAALFTPFTARTLRSMLCTQEEHVMPSTCKDKDMASFSSNLSVGIDTDFWFI